jgi:tRNA U34 5-carboxymethylaminomethyl modifying GTPase MnmE/TrmE
MNLPRSVRVLIAMGVLVLSLAALLLILTISETTLNIRSHLEQVPAWFGYAWWGMIAAASVFTGWLLWRILRPRASRSVAATTDAPPPPSESQLESAVDSAEELGVDTARARSELAELQRRREAGEIHVALFGEISTGKSSLVRALLPTAEARADVRGGTTRQLATYRWRSPAGDVLSITDMPGTAEAGNGLDRLAVDEAKRAHIVVYVTDGDLNRQQHAQLQELIGLDKPLVLTLSKTDRYSDSELEQLRKRLGDLVAGKPRAVFVSVTAAREREVIKQLPDGSERTETRTMAPQIGPLAAALQRLIDENQSMLDSLRDSATFVLVAQQLDVAVAETRKTRADKLVDGYAIKAVFGAMAAITPGSDLVIQGWLGTRMVRELAALYETRVSKVDTELLLELVQQHVGRAHTLILAVAGNALKAFPGIGTLAGGALHALAYGIIFRTLGRALTTTLATRGELHPRQTAKLFQEELGEDLEKPAKSLARLILEESRKDAEQRD